MSEWRIPTLKELRLMARGHVQAYLPNSGSLLKKTLARVLAEISAGFAWQNLKFIDRYRSEIFVTLCSEPFLQRHAEIWNVPRKAGSAAAGEIYVYGTAGSLIPKGAILRSGDVEFETTDDVYIGDSGSGALAPVRALDFGVAGNLAEGGSLQFLAAVAGVVATASVSNLYGGVDDEGVEDWRARILHKIRNPAHGGNAQDYWEWATSVDGCTRCKVVPNGMGRGTVLLYPMFDDLRADNYGIPEPEDLKAVKDYIETVRPVTVKEIYVASSEAVALDIVFTRIDGDSESTRGSIISNLKYAQKIYSSQGETAWRSRIAEAASTAQGENSHDLVFANKEMKPGQFWVIDETRVQWPEYS